MTNKEKFMNSFKMDIQIQKEKKELAEKLAERIKNEFYIQFDEIIPSIMADQIDKIVKEVLDEEFFGN
jgi:hypothetical protein